MPPALYHLKKRIHGNLILDGLQVILVDLDAVGRYKRNENSLTSAGFLLKNTSFGFERIAFGGGDAPVFVVVF
jgi:hypothetical protein